MPSNFIAVDLEAVVRPDGSLTKGVVEALAGLRECNYKIHLYTVPILDLTAIRESLKSKGVPFDDIVVGGRPNGAILYIDQSTMRFTGDWSKDEFRIYALLATPVRQSSIISLKAGWDGDHFKILLLSHTNAMLVLRLTPAEWNAMKRVAKDGMDQEWREISPDFSNVEKPNGDLL